jgi:hypothetical protein
MKNYKDVFVVIHKEDYDTLVYKDKEGVAKYLGVHRNTIYNRLNGVYMWEDEDFVIVKATFQLSNRGGFREKADPP